MSDIRFNTWLHRTGSGGVYQDSSGRVGIGTSVPTSALSVVGVVSATSFTGNLTGNINATGVSTFSAGPVLIGSGTSTRTASQSLQVTGGAYVSGNLGVGVTNPQAKLDIIGALKLQETVGNNAVVSSIIYRNSNSIGFDVVSLDTLTGSNIYEGVFRIQTKDSGGTLAERLRLTSGGNLGIGTNNPSNLIHLYSTSDGAELLQLEIGAQPATSEKGKIIWRATQTNGQSAKLTSIGATAVSNWGGEFQIFTKPANSTPNDTIIERVRVDNAGRVTAPYQPGFFASSTSANSNQPATGATDDLGPRFNITSQTGGFNIGNHYNTSTGVFTAPVSGKYYTFFNMRWETLSFVQNNYIRIFISINGSNTFHIHQINGGNEAWNSYMAMSCSGVVSLSAGDTLRPRGGLEGGTAVGYWNESSWGAWLLG